MVASKYLNDIDVKSSVGVVCKSKSFGDFKIVEYKGYNNVVIEFLETGYRKSCDAKEVKTGSVKDKLLPTVLGVGIVGDKYKTKVDGKHTKEYSIWRGLFKRCYDEKFHKNNITYVECEVVGNFIYYDKFFDWCNKQIGFGVDGFEIDKDLLIKGNKYYSEDFCVFLPKEINTALTKRGNDRGDCAIGVSYRERDRMFYVRVGKGEFGRANVGRYKTELEAFSAYKKEKEKQLRYLANKWKDQIDERAYNALMNYEVSIDD